MSLLMLPDTVDTIVLPLPHLLAKADRSSALEPDARRPIYFETSREGVIDRQGEDIAADALWASRKTFLQHGNLDLWHWSWLGNPPGTGQRPEYVIGLPTAVKRRGKSIWVAGEIFSNLTKPPEDSSGYWADRFWHSVTQMRPPMRWFPSVFGRMSKQGVQMQIRNGRKVRFITGPMEWFSVGFAQRAQHPELPAVSITPAGPWKNADASVIAKAMQSGRPGIRGNIAVLSLERFAKAVQSAQAISSGEATALDSKGQLTGVPALRRENLDKNLRRISEDTLFKRTYPKVIKALLNRQSEGTLEDVTAEFRRQGVPETFAESFAVRLGQWADKQAQKHQKNV